VVAISILKPGDHRIAAIKMAERWRGAQAMCMVRSEAMLDGS